jgi:hypothetical protein
VSTVALPRWRCHKVVSAFRIEQIVFLIDGLELASTDHRVIVNDAYVRKHNPQVGGYYTRYEDGYESWSPAEAFEAGYSLMPEPSPGCSSTVRT